MTETQYYYLTIITFKSFKQLEIDIMFIHIHIENNDEKYCNLKYNSAVEFIVKSMKKIVL